MLHYCLWYIAGPTARRNLVHEAVTEMKGVALVYTLYGNRMFRNKTNTDNARFGGGGDQLTSFERVAIGTLGEGNVSG